MPERALLRLGSVALMLGSIFAAVVDALHPRATDLEDAEEVLTQISQSGIWVGDHVGILFAVLLSVGGLLALSRSITGDVGTALGRLAMGAALIGGAIIAVLIGVDGIAAKEVADHWAAASGADKTAAFFAGQALLEVSAAIFTSFIIVFLGITPILFGTAILMGEGYPNWLGAGALLIGAVLLLTGLFGAYNGLTVGFITSYIIFGSLLKVWGLVAGALMWRRVGTLAPATRVV
jgi:hypothetical protein